MGALDGYDGFTGFAGVLWANVAMNEESGGFHVKLFGDVFSDVSQIAAASVTLARCGFMPVFDARQVIWQRLTTGAGTRHFGGIGG